MEPDKTCSNLNTALTNHLSSRAEWADKQKVLIQKRLAYRPAMKKYPYKGAANFVESIIDDNVRIKTDQEINMLLNTPRIVHAVPLVPGVTTKERTSIEQAYDSYWRWIIGARAKLEQATDTKNERGFTVLKVVRRFNFLLQEHVPDFEVRDPLSVVVPCNVDDIENSEFIADIMWFTKHSVRASAKRLDWNNVDDLLSTVADKNTADTAISHNNETPQAILRPIVGLTDTDAVDGDIPIAEVYHVATKEDEEKHELEEGARYVTIFSPHAPTILLKRYKWEYDQVEGGEEDVRVRPWPFVQCKFEERSSLYYDSRGMGHLLLDNQIEASQVKNMLSNLREYYQVPLFKGPVRHSGNVNFTPGSIIPQDLEPVRMPEVPSQMAFDISQIQSQAARKVGSGGLYNFSETVGERRKLEKTATEVETESARAAGVSSTAVDRFNAPLIKLHYMIWEDLKRANLSFPIISPVSSGEVELFDVRMYQYPVLLVPASTSKHFNPEVQMRSTMNIVGWVTEFAKANAININAEEIVESILALYDSRITSNWFIPTEGYQGNMPTSMVLKQIEEGVISLAQNGKRQDGDIQELGNSLKELNKHLTRLQNDVGALVVNESQPVF